MQQSFLNMIRMLTVAAVAFVTLIPLNSVTAAEPAVISEVVVTGQRREQSKFLHAGNIEKLDEAVLERVQHQHISELLSRVAGVWVVRGSGQDHQTSIRSPVLSGGGSCGGFLFLEDGIPVRPSGFCHVNQMVEIDTEQAQAIEVIRGPGNALFGSNALHGIVNVLMPEPSDNSRPHAALEIGSNDYQRLRVSLPFASGARWLASLVYTNDDGFRMDSGYRQAKLHLKHRSQLFGGTLITGFTATDLDQESAGFIFGKDAYNDPAKNRTNPNPEAFRKVSSQRLYGIWTRSFSDFELDVRPYGRHSDMQFRHHALPGQPLESNGHVSAGVITAATFSNAKFHTVVGVDVELSDMYVRQTQLEATRGNARSRETRPQGKHYDYQIDAYSLAPFVQSEYQASEQISLGAGIRLEYMHYDYDNQMLNGNTRDDGSVCGFGGCLYSRPADRSDSFNNIAPKLSASFQISPQSKLYANLARGFRAPQTTELYRLQNGQQVSDLDSERIDSLELGLRTNRESWSGDISLYVLQKQDSVFRDADGFNISGARSRHRGIEVALDWQLAAAWQIALDASYARHTYDFTFSPQRGERFVSGNDVDTAPRWLGSTELLFTPHRRLNFGLQWTMVGDYFLDSENRFTYPGHSLTNLRAGFDISPSYSLVLRLKNLADKRFADRADFGAGDYRYLPGRGRELFAEIRYSPSQSK
jgi:outer membrane receptor protein involved in Fe transport